MKKVDCTGKLIAMDMYNCDAGRLSEPAGAEELLRQACNENDMGLLDIVCSKDELHTEYSLVAVCDRGHVCLHIYPQLGFIAGDVFSARQEADSGKTARQLREMFAADKAKITLLDRGDFGSESDMKPHRRSNIKLIRRTVNFGGKLKKMMLKPRGI